MIKKSMKTMYEKETGLSLVHSTPSKYMWNHDIQKGPPTEEAWVKLYPENKETQYCLKNGRIEFIIPKDGWYEFDKGFISFQPTTVGSGLDTTVGTYLALPQYCHASIWERVKLEMDGNKEIEYIQKYGQISTIKLRNTLNGPQVSGFSGTNCFGRQTERVGYITDNTRIYGPIHLQSLTDRPMPIKYIRGQSKLTFYLCQNHQLESDYTTPDLGIQDCQLYVKRLIHAPEFDRKYLAQKLVMKYQTWNQQTVALTSGVQKFTIELNTSSRNLRGLCWSIIAATDVQLKSRKGKYFKPVHIDAVTGSTQKWLQFKVGSFLWPQEKIDLRDSGLLYIYNQEFWDWIASGEERFKSTKNMIGGKVEAALSYNNAGTGTLFDPTNEFDNNFGNQANFPSFLFETNANEGFQSGVDATENIHKLIMEIDFGAAIITSHEMTIFFAEERVVTFNPVASRGETEYEVTYMM